MSRVAVVVTGICHTAMALGAHSTLSVAFHRPVSLSRLFYSLVHCFLCFYATTGLFLSPRCPSSPAGAEAFWGMIGDANKRDGRDWLDTTVLLIVTWNT